MGSTSGVVNSSVPTVPTTSVTNDQATSAFAASSNAATQSTSGTAPISNSSGSFVTVNAFGVIMPNPTEATMQLQKRNRDACTILGRVITAELHRRAGVFWPHHVWVNAGDTARSFVVRVPNPLRIQSGLLAGIHNIDLQRADAVLKVLEIEYEFILDLF